MTPSQLALAWVLSQGNDIVPIPGTAKAKHIEQNAAAVDIELTAADLASLDEIFPKDAASGARYPEAAMASVNK